MRDPGVKLPILEIDTTRNIKNIENLFGIFFEDINHAADGGLYAEYLQNGSFEYSVLDKADYNNMTGWEVVERGAKLKTMVRTGTPPFPQNPHYLQMCVIGETGCAGVRNLGYHGGFPVRAGAEYIFSCYARSHDNFKGEVTVILESRDDKVIYTFLLPVLTGKWEKYELKFSPDITSEAAELLILVHGEGFVDIDMVSLKPLDTFGDVPGLFRKDIALLIADLKPKFMRFPGGCLVADGSPDADNRCSLYRWKNTIGPLEMRPSRRNSWGYNQSLGIGFYEYFLFCEAVGAEPVPVLPVCRINGNPTPMDELEELIGDAIDLISFANDGADTPWGRKRAELGHPQPFCLKYLALGNEEVGETFFSLYPYFHKAIKEKYPSIKLINSGSPFAASTEYDRGWDSARANGSELVDEHYYQAPEWFLANMDRYDSFDPEGPRVFLGEYASCSNTYYNALVEAAYMTHLEKALAVEMACYAPLLCNSDYVNWHPDMIWYDQSKAYGSANYYVQKLFANHQGTHELPAALYGIPESPERETTADERIKGPVIFNSRKGCCEVTEIELICEDSGKIVRCENQTVPMEESRVLFPEVDSENYTISFKACKTEVDLNHWRPGNLSFDLCFGQEDPQNAFYWGIGGWANGDCVVEHRINNRGSILHHTVFSVELGRTYECKLKVRGRQIETWIDGRRMNHAVDKLPVIRPLYYAASEDKESGEFIIKVVNVTEERREAVVSLKLGEQNGGQCGFSGTLFRLAGYSLDAVNSFEEPEKIKPEETAVSFPGNSFVHCFPAHSVSVFRLRRE